VERIERNAAGLGLRRVGDEADTVFIHSHRKPRLRITIEISLSRQIQS
jgi:hypothetical protein